MTEIKHLRCDRCGRDMIVDDRSRLLGEAARLWAHCTAHLDDYDYCPLCWKEIMEFIKTDSVQEIMSKQED